MAQTVQQEVVDGAIAIRDRIATALESSSPLLIGRHGTFEFQCVLWSMKNPDSPMEDKMISVLNTNAGIFPKTRDAMKEWLEAYWLASKLADGLATGWYLPTAEAEKRLVTEHCPNALQFPLRSLEPYYVAPEHRWTRLLENRRVCVVSSFTQTMATQVMKGRRIWPKDGSSILPQKAKWSFVRSYYPPELTNASTAWLPGISSWKEAVESIVLRVLQTDPEIILIGCGGLAMVAAAELKKRGKIAIVLGGAIQVLFGIKGSRWKKHEIISDFWNDAWTSPRADEVPSHAFAVEGGCYW